MIFLTDSLTFEKIITFIQKFVQYESPRLEKYFNYYEGNQAILRKMVNDPTKPCNRIVTNYCYTIVGNYQGYLTGQDITYTSPNDISAIVDILSYNDVRTEDSELLKQALIYGRSFEINYVDEDGKQRFKVLDTRQCIPVYDDTLNQNLLCVIRFYPIDQFDVSNGYNVDIYYTDRIEHYTMNTGFTTLRFTGEEQHFYHQVPVTVFSLNPEEKSIFDKIMGLQDAYNTLLSSEVDDFEAFCDAYLVLKNVTATADDVAEMKEKRVIVLPYAAQGVDPDASFLNKNISDTQIENMLTNIDEQIHKISNSPDFTDEAFGTSSGVAMKYKLLGFENTAGTIAANMTKALQKRLELICEILNLTSGEQMWRDVEITFTRNLPVDLAETANLVNILKGTVSDRTLLSLLPFVSDIDKELEMVEESKLRNMELYSFSSNSTSDETEETE